MLETANWIQKYFNQSPDAIFLFKNDDLLVSNEPAQRLVTMLNLDVNYLLQIGKNAWSQLENDDCASCLIKKRSDNISFQCYSSLSLFNGLSSS